MKLNEVELSEDNLRAGLDTFAGPTTSRYKNAVKLYGVMIKAGANPYKAIEETLEMAVQGLQEDPMRLPTARIAAGVTLVQRSDDTTTSVFGIPLNTVPTPLPLVERRAAAKLHPILKARKGTVFGWFLLGIIMGWLITLFAQGVTWITTGIVWNPWVPWYLIYPLSIIAFTAYGYQKAIRPRSTEDSEEAKSALYPNGYKTQEVK